VANGSCLSRVAEWRRWEALIAIIGRSGVRFRVGGAHRPSRARRQTRCSHCTTSLPRPAPRQITRSNFRTRRFVSWYRGTSPIRTRCSHCTTSLPRPVGRTAGEMTLSHARLSLPPDTELPLAIDRRVCRVLRGTAVEVRKPGTYLFASKVRIHPPTSHPGDNPGATRWFL